MLSALTTESILFNSLLILIIFGLSTSASAWLTSLNDIEGDNTSFIMDIMAGFVITLIICLVMYSSVDDVRQNKDLTISQNYHMTHTKEKGLSEFDILTFEKVKNAKYDNNMGVRILKPLKKKAKFTVVKHDESEILLEDEHSKTVSVNKKDYPRLWSAIEQVLK